MFERNIIKVLKEITGLSQIPLEIPPQMDLGEYAFPCFILAKTWKKSPAVCALEIAEKFTTGEEIDRVEAVGPYVNFYVHRKEFAKKVLTLIQSSDFGAGFEKNKKVMIEYSQPNTHKAFHVGHIRGTAVGESLSRILRLYGYPVVQANYMGDTGAHVAKWLWCYTTYHQGEEPPQQDREKWIASIYVEAVRRLSEDESLEDAVNLINHALENNEDARLTALWQKTRQWSLDAFDAIYKDLDANFDFCFFEGEMENRGKELVSTMVDKGLSIYSDGAIIINLEKFGLAIWVLLRKDGTALYSAKDLALAEKKFTELGIDTSVYIVGNAQSLHLQQLFKCLELLEYPQAKDCYHLSFDEVRLPTGKMSSRTGVNILYADLRNELMSYAKSETRKRHDDWDDATVERKALGIAIAALKFDMLKMDNNKVIVFHPEKATEFEGETGPYVQYAHARVCSILRKATVVDADASLLTELSEHYLIRTLSQFPAIIAEAALQYKPSLVCRYVLDLSQMVNSYYHDVPVLKADEDVRNARILLLDCVRQVLSKALFVLGLEAPDEM